MNSTYHKNHELHALLPALTPVITVITREALVSWISGLLLGMTVCEKKPRRPLLRRGRSWTNLAKLEPKSLWALEYLPTSQVHASHQGKRYNCPQIRHIVLRKRDWLVDERFSFSSLEVKERLVFRGWISFFGCSFRQFESHFSVGIQILNMSRIRALPELWIFNCLPIIAATTMSALAKGLSLGISSTSNSASNPYNTYYANVR